MYNMFINLENIQAHPVVTFMPNINFRYNCQFLITFGVKTK